MKATQRGFLAAIWLTYRMRWKRRRFLFRIWRKRKQIGVVVDRTGAISNDSILCFSTVRNEMLRLPHFLEHYRKLGVGHFVIVDNDSDDGTAAYLADQSDVSLWTTSHSYRLARFGMDWLGWLQWQLGQDHWCLTVDADELLIYPYCEKRDLNALTAWLDDQGAQSFGALMLDMYPQGPVNEASYQSGDDPTNTLCWFDATLYREQVHPVYDNLWVQGGVRERVFFVDDPKKSPTLSKIPLARWQWRQVYVNSTHQMLPCRLNDVFDRDDDRKTTGILLHTKFLPNIAEKSVEEIERGQHFENSSVYQDYHQALTKNPVLWNPASCRYRNAAQLVELELMSKGRWV